MPVCPTCGEEFEGFRGKILATADGSLRSFCSESCREISKNPPPVVVIEAEHSISIPNKETQRVPAWVSIGAALVGLVGTLALPNFRSTSSSIAKQSPRIAVAQAAAASSLQIVAPVPLVLLAAMNYGPVLPPKDAPKKPEVSLSLAGEWVHPLYGPTRQLPVRNTRRFGAAREGIRPDECHDGHCGVDLGQHRGDTVLNVHDGVVEIVCRDGDSGGHGLYVRMRHAGGLSTSYMHLDRVRADLKPGQVLKAGEQVGVIGDTGVKHSGPHLHFAVSVHADDAKNELYINPEPLLHIWPVKNPGDKLSDKTKLASIQ